MEGHGFLTMPRSWNNRGRKRYSKWHDGPFLRRQKAASLIGFAARRYLRRNKKRMSSGRGVTNQYDRSSVYRKKRMPYKKRKRWGSFCKKVKAAENHSLGTRTRVYNKRLNYETQPYTGGPQTVTPNQIFKSLTLYGCNDFSGSAGEDVRRDLENILATDGEISKSGKIQMISGIFDMTLVNKSNDALGQEMGIELDVYLITAGKQFRFKDTTGVLKQGSLEDVLQESSKVMSPVGSSSTYNTTDVGTTPFDFTSALSNFKIKVLKKTKYFLPYGHQMTYQIRDPKNRSFMKDSVLDMQGSNYPGVTKHLLLVAKGLPGSVTTNETGDNLYQLELAIGLTRKYAYKVNEDDEDRAGIST